MTTDDFCKWFAKTDSKAFLFWGWMKTYQMYTDIQAGFKLNC